MRIEHDQEVASFGSCDCAACVDQDIQELDGRFMVATWSTQQQQWQSNDLRASARFQGYCYTYARSLEGLRSAGIKTYRTRSGARRAARAQ